MKKRYLVIFIISFLLSALIEGGIVLTSNQIYDYEQYENMIELYPGETYEMSEIAYSVDGTSFTPQNNDPQLLFNKVGMSVEGVLITFSEGLPEDTIIEVYYETESNVFDEQHVVRRTVSKGNEKVYLDLPAIQCVRLRIDINGKFKLESIKIADSDLVEEMHYEKNFNVAQLIVFFLTAFVLLVIFNCWLHKKPDRFFLSKTELAYCAFCFLFYLAWAVSKELNYAPDEYMRYDVSLFFYNHNRLPKGTETINQIWGFSYAHLPTMLCSILSYIPMKIAGMLWKDSSFALLLAARMVSVCCGTGVVYFVIKITKRLFQTPARWIMIIFISMIPQYAFLCSYVNNDIIALLGCSMILYSWLWAMDEKWNLRIALLLAVGIITCALSYYNSYGWILCSIIFFIATYMIQYKKDYKGLIKLGCFISVVVLAGISYMFIRHIVLYGDLIGWSTTRRYGELYGIEFLKMSNRVTLKNSGVTLSEMLFGRYQWVETTYKSAVGIFGYMNVYMHAYVYKIYALLFCFCMLCGIWNFCRYVKKGKIDFTTLLFYGCNLVCIIIPVALSIYKSYGSDFQPQGRYCYPAILAIAVFMTKGVDNLFKKIRQKEWGYGIVGVYAGFFVAITVSEFFTTYLAA